MTDPFIIKQLFWPDVCFFDKQWEIILSVWNNYETVVPAANMLGKDFTAGFVALARILARKDDGSEKQTRVVTTSVKDDHLRVLFGEIGRFIQSSKHPLTADKGGPLIFNHRDIRKIVVVNGRKEVCPITYLRGMVSERGEGLAGHHAEDTLGVIDEASGVDPFVFTQMQTWAKSMLVFGNCNETDVNHPFRKAVREGDLVAV